MAKTRMFAIIAERNPAIYDLIPRGPQLVARITRAGGAAMLNPQPLPPKEQYLSASVELAQDVARAAAVAELYGASPSDMLGRIVDEWCGTPWPRPFPWPGPVDPEPEPHPDWDIAAGRLVGAMTLADIAERTPAGELRDALQRGAEQLAEVSAR